MRGLSVGVLTDLAEALGAHVDLRLTWNGEMLDRLLDADHAATVAWVVELLRRAGWDVATEATFQIYGERGSIDVLARHTESGILLVIEVKTLIPDLQAMLAAHDRKARLAPTIARDRGWPTGPVAKLLVVVDGRTTRRRVLEHQGRFRQRLPGPVTGGAGVAPQAHRRWPGRACSGLLFAPDIRQTAARQRVTAARRGEPTSPRTGARRIARRTPPEGAE